MRKKERKIDMRKTVQSMLIITIETGIKILLNSNSIRKTFSITYPSRRTQRIHMDFRQDFKQKQSIIFR